MELSPQFEDRLKKVVIAALALAGAKAAHSAWKDEQLRGNVLVVGEKTKSIYLSLFESGRDKIIELNGEQDSDGTILLSNNNIEPEHAERQVEEFEEVFSSNEETPGDSLQTG